MSDPTKNPLANPPLAGDPLLEEKVSTETPEDVAVLYNWANLQGAQYRDFSASRREYRAQMHRRAAEQRRKESVERVQQAEAEAALREAAEREENERRAREEEAARQAEELQRQRIEQTRAAAAAARAAQEEYEAQEAARAAQAAQISREAAAARAMDDARMAEVRAQEVRAQEAARAAEASRAAQAARDAAARAQETPSPSRQFIPAAPVIAAAATAAAATAETVIRQQAEEKSGGVVPLPPQAQDSAFPQEAFRLPSFSARETTAYPLPNLYKEPVAPPPPPAVPQFSPSVAEVPTYKPEYMRPDVTQVVPAARPVSRSYPAAPTYQPVTPTYTAVAPPAPVYSAPPVQSEVPPPPPTSMDTASYPAYTGYTPAEPPVQQPAQQPIRAASQPEWLTGTVPVAQPRRTPSSASPISDTLQYSREKVASRWFALKGIFEPGREPEQPQPVRQKETQQPTLALFSLAGGVGKTSMVATLGRTLSALGEKTLLLDTTAYGLLPFYFGARELRPNTMRTFAPPVGSTDAPIHMISMNTDVKPQSDPTAPADTLIEDIQRNARGTNRIVIDVTTAAAPLARRLMKLAPVVLVPVAPDMSSVISLNAVEQFFKGQVDAEGRPVKVYYLLNQFDAAQPLHLDVREVLRQQLGDRLLPFVIRRSPAVSEALAEGMTVMDYAPNSPAAEDFLNLANWLRNVSAPVTAGFRGIRWSEQG